MTADPLDDYDFTPEGMVTCDRCDGAGFIEYGDDVISEEIYCPVCHGEGLITTARWEKRRKAHQELMKAIWRDKAPE